jgi:predicted HTH domain antitoxin
MALVRATLKNEIKTLLNDLKDDLNQDNAIEKYAEKLSLAVDNYVKSATVVGTDSQGGPITGSLE